MDPVLNTRRGRLYCGDLHEVLPALGAGWAHLIWFDGPYGMGKAEWDRFPNLTALIDWYRRPLALMTEAAAPSASVYLWGTDETEAALRDPMRALGWTLRGRVTWVKPSVPNSKSDPAMLRTWIDVTECCGFYQREAWAPSTCAGSEIAYAAGADDRNRARLFLASEWAESGLPRRAADLAMGTNGMAGHYFGTSQWSLPTWDAYHTLAAYADTHGAERARPYLVLPECWQQHSEPLRASYDHLREEYDHLREEYDHLREEYEASRPAFNCPVGVSNVWRHPQVSGADRLRLTSGKSHPCQKPLAFARRAILASSRPGETVLDLCAGTHRIAVACERLPESEARRHVSIEYDPRWVELVRPLLTTALETTATATQPSLFGGL